MIKVVYSDLEILITTAKFTVKLTAVYCAFLSAWILHCAKDEGIIIITLVKDQLRPKNLQTVVAWSKGNTRQSKASHVMHLFQEHNKEPAWNVKCFHILLQLHDKDTAPSS